VPVLVAPINQTTRHFERKGKAKFGLKKIIGPSNRVIDSILHSWLSATFIVPPISAAPPPSRGAATDFHPSRSM
jgi:hypothetical protein